MEWKEIDGIGVGGKSQSQLGERYCSLGCIQQLSVQIAYHFDRLYSIKSVVGVSKWCHAGSN